MPICMCVCVCVCVCLYVCVCMFVYVVWCYRQGNAKLDILEGIWLAKRRQEVWMYLYLVKCSRQ